MYFLKVIVSFGKNRNTFSFAKAKRTQQMSIVVTCDFCFFQLLHTADLSLLETISEALLPETFLWGCVGVIF